MSNTNALNNKNEPFKAVTLWANYPARNSTAPSLRVNTDVATLPAGITPNSAYLSNPTTPNSSRLSGRGSPPPQPLTFQVISQATSTDSNNNNNNNNNNDVLLLVVSRKESDHNTSEADDSNDVSQALITKINSRIGHIGDKELADSLITKMRRLGGLEALQTGETIDIPSARKGLCILAGLEDTPHKMQALDSLLTILKHDHYHTRTADNLVHLAVMLMHQMDKDIVQGDTLAIQIKLAQVYDELTLSLHRHYGKRHINAITRELKRQLEKTAKALENLNGLDDLKLKFHVKCALEGVRRLKDDRQELFIFLESIYRLAATAASVFLQDAQGALTNLEAAFKNIDVYRTEAWYDAMIINKNLIKEGKKDINRLAAAQALAGSKYRVLNWKFSYAAVNALYEVCMQGENKEIRSQAFFGFKDRNVNLPGFTYFAACEDIPIYVNMAPLKDFQSPVTVNPNGRIRQLCAILLRNLAENAPDELVRIEAQALIIKRLNIEPDPLVKKTLDHSLHRIESTDSL